MTVIQTIDLARNLLNESLAAGRSFPDNTSSFYTDSILLGYFNREQQIIQNHLIESFENYFVTSALISTVNGTDEYIMNTSVIKILRMEWIADDSSSPIEIFPTSFNDKEVFRGLNTGVTAAGQVRTYSIKGESFILRPIPGRTITEAIKYFFVKELSDLTLGTEQSEIPSRFHEIISLGIYKRALMQQEGSAESVGVAIKEYSDLIRDMKQWAENRQIQRPRFVKRRKNRRGL